MLKRLLGALGLTTIKSKVVGLSFFSCLVLLLIVVSSSIYLNQIKNEFNSLKTQGYDLVSYMDRVQNGLNNTLSALHTDGSSDPKNTIINFWVLDLQQLTKQIESGLNTSTASSQNRELLKLTRSLSTAKALLEENGLSENQVDHGQLSRAETRIEEAIAGSITSLENLKASVERRIETQTAELDSQITTLTRINYGFGILFLFLILFLGFRLRNRLGILLERLKTTANQLKSGDIPEKNETREDEFGEIYQELNEFFDMLETVKSFSKEVGNGKFDSQIQVFDNKGELGSSLTEMKDSLYKVAREDEQRNWINKGFAKFGDILRNNHDDITMLGDELLSELVKYLNANQGALYLRDSREEEKSTDTLKAVSCYAFNKKKMLDKEIIFGEGLVGAAWQEKETVYLTDIPDDYINIRSGLGGANPKSILIQPLQTNEAFVGVLEIASFNEVQEYEKQFIQKISENIAATVATVFNNTKTKELLEESKQMAEEMKAQEEELRQNMEELEATQEEMRRAQDEIKKKEANLTALIDNTEDTIFAIDRDYEITVVNKTLRNKYINLGIDLKIGKNIFDVLPKDTWEHWKARYDRALSGEKFTKMEESSGSEGKKYVETHHNPIKDEAGNVIGCSVIAKDITKVMTMQKELENKESTMKSLIDNTDDTYFAIDTDYNITVVNQTLKERFEKTGITMNEGENIFDKLPKDSHQFWKEKYDRSLNGEAFEFFQERPVKDKVLYLKAYSNPVKDEDGNIIGASVMSRDITEWKNAVDLNEELKYENAKLKKQLGLELNIEEKKLLKEEEIGQN